jgi:hypothetical protein
VSIVEELIGGVLIAVVSAAAPGPMESNKFLAVRNGRKWLNLYQP